MINLGIISKEELSPYIFGAVDTFEYDGWVCFSRFTEKQGQWLKNNNFPREKCSASGMRLEFNTKGGMLSFDYYSEQSTCVGNAPIFGLEITLDGMPAYHIYREELPLTDKVEFEIPNSDDFVHVAVYFPLRASLRIKNVIMPDDVRPVKKELKILTLGDSITAGAVCKHSNHCYVNFIADKLNAELLNQGVGGSKFPPEFLDDLPFDPDIVTVAYGVNDFFAGVILSETPKIYFEKIYERYKDKKILVLLPIWCGREDTGEENKLELGRKYIREIAQKYPNTSVIDCKNFVPRLPEFYWDDECVHPNDLGFMYYDNNLIKSIKPLIK